MTIYDPFSFFDWCIERAALVSNGVPAIYDDDLLHYDILHDTLYDLQIFTARTTGRTACPCYEFRAPSSWHSSHRYSDEWRESARLNEKEEGDDTRADVND